jgi:hypothetical protein
MKSSERTTLTHIFFRHFRIITNEFLFDVDRETFLLSRMLLDVQHVMCANRCTMSCFHHVTMTRLDVLMWIRKLASSRFSFQNISKVAINVESHDACN